MRRRRLAPQTRRRQIIEAAMAVFAREGFDGASMDEIVREAGLSKGGVYWHFKSKDDIVVAVLEGFFDQEMVFLEALRQAPGTAGERLRRLGQQVAQDVQQLAPYGGIVLQSYALAARRADIRGHIQDYWAAYGTGLAALLQQAVDAGEFVLSQSQLEDVTLTLVALFEGLVLMWTIAPGAFDLASQAEAAIDVLVRGLQAGIGP